MIVPCTTGCSGSLNAYVPGVLKTWEAVPEALIAGLLGPPAMEMAWERLPVLDQTTRVPTLIVDVEGDTPLSVIVMIAWPASAAFLAVGVDEAGWLVAAFVPTYWTGVWLGGTVAVVVDEQPLSSIAPSSARPATAVLFRLIALKCRAPPEGLGLSPRRSAVQPAAGGSARTCRGKVSRNRTMKMAEQTARCAPPQEKRERRCRRTRNRSGRLVRSG